MQGPAESGRPSADEESDRGSLAAASLLAAHDQAVHAHGRVGLLVRVTGRGADQVSRATIAILAWSSLRTIQASLRSALARMR